MTNYKLLDYNTGILIQTYRQKAGLTQIQLAKLIKASKRSIINWEAGFSHPQSANLRRLVQLFLDKGCFTPDNEIAEARILWDKVSQPKEGTGLDTFNMEWFKTLLQERVKDKGETGQIQLLTFQTKIHYQDLDEAVDRRGVPLYGRNSELKDLEKWVIKDKYRLIGIYGMGGIGKTTLAVDFAHKMVPHFEYVIFRTLINAPTLQELFDTILECLLQGRLADLPILQSEKLAMIMDYFRQHSCLLVLDNFETVLQAGLETGRYAQAYNDYADFIRRVSEFSHISCLLITSREKPTYLTLQEGKYGSVRSLSLKGLDKKSCQAILGDMHIESEEEQSAQLAERYSGNPLALKMVAEPIQLIFGGNLTTFLASDTYVIGKVHFLLSQQFDRLSQVEREILYWLALSREPIRLETLQKWSLLKATFANFSEGLNSLINRFLIEGADEKLGFTLHGVIVEYVTERFINQIFTEIIEQKPNLLRLYPLVQTQTRHSNRHIRLRVIVQPLLTELRSAFKGNETLITHLKQLLSQLKTVNRPDQGYAGGNLLNLLLQLEVDISGWDLSGLNLWQADLAGATLHNIDMRESDLAGSSFIEADLSAYSLAYSKDGSQLAIGCANGMVKVWSVGALFGSLLLECSGHKNLVTCVTFSPDSRLLASGSMDGTVRLWEVASGNCLAVFQGSPSPDVVRSVTFSPDGKILVSSGYNPNLYVWDVSKAQLLRTFDADQGWVMNVAFSPDGKFLASGGYDGTIKLWHSTSLNTGPGSSLSIGYSFGPGAKIANKIDTVTTLDPETPSEEKKPLKPAAVLSGHQQRLNSIAFSPNGKLLASGSADETVRVWSVARRKCMQTLEGHSGIVMVVAFSPDGQILGSGGLDGQINLWTVTQLPAQKSLVPGNGAVIDLAFNPAGNTFVTACSEISILKLWSNRNLELIDVLQGHLNIINTLTVSNDGRWLAGSSGDGDLLLWDLSVLSELLPSLPGSTLTLASEHYPLSPTQNIKPVQNEPSSQASYPGTAQEEPSNGRNGAKTGRLSGNLKPSVLKGHSSIIAAVTFDKESKIIASGSLDATLKLWGLGSVKSWRTLNDSKKPVNAVVFSPDNHLILSGDDAGTIRLWSMITGEMLKSLPAHQGRIRKLLFTQVAVPTNASANGTSAPGNTQSSYPTHLVTCAEDGLIQLWLFDSQNLELQPLAVWPSHQELVMDMTFNGDGSLLFSGGSNGVLACWNGKTGEHICATSAHAGLIRSIVYHPNRQLLVTGGEDGFIRTWQVVEEDYTGKSEYNSDNKNEKRNITVRKNEGAKGKEPVKARIILQASFEFNAKVLALAITPDGRTLFSAGEGNIIKVWNLDEGEARFTLSLPVPYEGLKIRGVQGLTEAQQHNLLSLGASNS